MLWRFASGRNVCGPGAARSLGFSAKTDVAERLDRVFVDTNELFPFTVMDLVLALAEHRLIEFVWTDELLDEWERVIVREGQRDVASARSVAATVRRFFAESHIDPATYRTGPWPQLPDPDDRVHGAAAIAGANVLLTRNLDDFPSELLGSVQVISADTYLTRLLRHRRRAFLDVLVGLAAEKRNPPVMPCEYAARLDRAGCTTQAASLRRALRCP
jgi:PIN domain